MADAVLVIDMLKGFLYEGYPLYCGDSARRIIPEVVNLLEDETGKGSRIFFIADSHCEDDAEFEIFPAHCIEGSIESEVIEEISRFPGERINKTRYSTFYKTNLDEKLAKVKPEKLIICGVCTNICVLHTVADARNRDYQVEIPVSCVSSFDQEAHEWALNHMEKILGARLIHPENR